MEPTGDPDWYLRAINAYCERQGPEFWAEPLNALTNAAFLVAAVLALMLAQRSGRMTGEVLWLSGLVFVIGIGSFLFHTFAVGWAGLMDVIPIAIFILSYFSVTLRYYFRLSWLWTAIGTVAFVGGLIGLTILLSRLLSGTGVSGTYLAAAMALIGVGGVLWSRGHPAGRWLIGAAAVFLVSLTFRTMDQPYCDQFPTGTHWLWHVLNGVVLGTLVVAVIRHGRRTTANTV